MIICIRRIEHGWIYEYDVDIGKEYKYKIFKSVDECFEELKKEFSNINRDCIHIEF